MQLGLGLFFALLLYSVNCAVKPPRNEEWNYRRGAEKVNLRGVANLTQVLDDWRYDIMTSMKQLLTHEHQSVLPDYSRIQPLSEALGDLYKEFNALKERLGELSEKFINIESFIDEVRVGRAGERPPTETGLVAEPIVQPAPPSIPKKSAPKKKMSPVKKKAPEGAH